MLPRHWDGSRLLRFLAGLAMLALAFTAHPPAAEPAAPAAAVVAPAPVRAAPAAAEPESAIAAPPTIPALPAPAPTAIITGSLVLLAGVALRVRASRAPPAV